MYLYNWQKNTERLAIQLDRFRRIVKQILNHKIKSLLMIQITDKPEQNPGWPVCYPIIRGLAFAVTSDGNVDELGDGDDWNLGVQDDAENFIIICSIEKMTK